MRLGLLGLLICMNGLVLAVSSYERQLQYEGAPATITVTVRDEHGVPVEGALGEAFYWSTVSNTESEVSDYSDENGNLLFREKGYCDAVFRITKGGYYETKGRVQFRLPAEDPEHFWQRKAWKPTHLDVVLKTIRNPIPGWLYAGKVITLPRYDIPLGLDLQLLDWVPPYGEGKHTDVILSFHLVDKQNRQEKWQEIKGVTFTFPNPGDGVQVCAASMDSSFLTDYSVDVSKPFLSTLTLTIGQKESPSRFLRSNTYLAFRVRSNVNKDGVVVTANYGSICYRIHISKRGLFFAGGGFNPTSNDTNIEFDPKQNLMPKRYKADLLKDKSLKEKASKEKKGYENTSF